MNEATMTPDIETDENGQPLPETDARGQLTRRGLTAASRDVESHENAMLDFFLSDEGSVEPDFWLGISRLADQGVAFHFRTVREDELKKLQKRAATGKTLRNGAKEVDQYKLNRLLLVETMLHPQLARPEIMQRFGTPADALEQKLLPGEIGELAEKVLIKSGFSDDAVFEDDDIDEVEVAKN